METNKKLTFSVIRKYNVCRRIRRIRKYNGYIMTDILFINPGNHKKTYQDLSIELSAIAPPVWTSLLANHAKNKGYETAIYDVNIEGWDENASKNILKKYSPELIVLMVYGHNPLASTQTMPSAGKIATDIKNIENIPIAMGGTHPSALPERTLNEEDIDYIIQGEGLYTVDGLIRYLKGKYNIDNVKGLWFVDNKNIKFTSDAPLIRNLDEELSGYAWDLLPDLKKYRAHNMHCFQDFEKSKKDDFSDIRSPYITMITSIGCPYKCDYCCTNIVFGKPGVRYWSLDKVFSWIDEIVDKYKVKNVRFDDELFILSHKRIEKFCEMMIERKYDLNIFVYGRVDTIKESLLKKMKMAGINWISLGIESGNERIRNSVNKNIKKDIKNIVRMIQDNNIYVLGNYMFGLPEDDFNTMNETSILAKELNCEYANFYSTIAYPGSKLYTLTENENLPTNWECFSQLGYETQPLSTRHISAKDVLKFRDDTFRMYHTNPIYLDSITKKFGEKVRKHIEKITATKINRKILEE